MPIPGSNAAYVQEIFDFVRSGRILPPEALPPADPDLLPISDFSQMMELYFGDEDRGSWKDIKHMALRPFFRLERSLTGSIIEEIERTSIELYNIIAAQLTGRTPEAVVDIAHDDMEGLMIVRAAFGKTDPFWERIFQIYQAGGCPIGWEGPYPGGRIITVFLGYRKHPWDRTKSGM